jgi:hypothetical protein
MAQQGWSAFSHAAIAVVLLLASLQLSHAALLDYGPIKPYGGDGLAEGFPFWYRDISGIACAPCLTLDPAGTGACLSTRVRSQ